MKKHYLLLALLLSISAVAFAFAEWKQYAIDQRVSVRLPSEPEKVDVADLLAKEGKTMPEGYVSRMLVAMDEAGTYQVVCMDDPTTHIFTATERNEYFDKVAAGIANTATIVKRRAFSTATAQGIEFQIRPHRMEGTAYARTLLVGGVGYTFSFMSRDQQDTTGTSGSAQRQQFFNSIVVKPAK